MERKRNPGWSTQRKIPLRLQIGLEDIEDLKADLAAGFKRLASYTPTAEPG